MALSFTLARILLPKPKANEGDDTQDGSTGVEELLADADGFSVHLSPNPTHGKYNLHISISQATEMSVVVRDATGKIVTQASLGKITDYTYRGTLTVAGVYLVEVQDKSGKVLSINKLIVL